MHEDCLRHDVLMRVYGRLGKTQPQKIDADAVMTTIEAAGAAFGDLKPINGGGIKEEEDVDTKKKASVDGTSMLMTPLTPRTELTPSQPLAENGNGTNGVLSPAQKAELPLLLGTGKVLEPGSSPFRKAVFSSGNNKKAKPYKGLYEAHMRLDDGPTAWVIRDLRNNVVGGHKMWLEKVSCLLCSYEID